MGRAFLFEWRQLWRRCGVVAAIAAGILAAVLELQRPARFVLDGGKSTGWFTWPSLEVGMVVLLAAALVAAGGSRGRAVRWGAAWERALVGGLVVFGFGLAILVGGAAVAATIQYTVYRIEGAGQAAGAFVVRSGLGFLPLAMLHPAFTSWSAPRPLVAGAWIVVVLSSAGIFGLGVPIPLDRVLAEVEVLPITSWAVSLAAATGAFALSTAAIASTRVDEFVS